MVKKDKKRMHSETQAPDGVNYERTNRKLLVKMTILNTTGKKTASMDHVDFFSVCTLLDLHANFKINFFMLINT